MGSIALPEKHSPMFSLGRSFRNFELHARYPAGAGSCPAAEQMQMGCNGSASPWAPHPVMSICASTQVCKNKQTTHPALKNNIWWGAGLQSLVESPPPPGPPRCKTLSKSLFLSLWQCQRAERITTFRMALAPPLAAAIRLSALAIPLGRLRRAGRAWLPSKEQQMQIFPHFRLGVAHV